MELIEPHLRRAIEDGVVDELRRNVEIEVVPIHTDMIITGTIGGALASSTVTCFRMARSASASRFWRNRMSTTLSRRR